MTTHCYVAIRRVVIFCETQLYTIVFNTVKLYLIINNRFSSIKMVSHVKCIVVSIGHACNRSIIIDHAVSILFNYYIY